MSDTQNATPTQEPAGGNEPEFSFDSWLTEQPEHVRKGYESHTGGLKNALEQERQQRKEFAKQLKDLSGKAEKGSEAERALGEMSARAELAEQRAAFYEEAGKPEIGCSNPRAAFLVASAEGLFGKRGEPDWQAIKSAAPELFAAKMPKGNAGSGAGASPASPTGMNAFIRAAAGRG